MAKMEGPPGSPLDGRVGKAFGPQRWFEKFFHAVLVDRMEKWGLNDTPVLVIMKLLSLYQSGKVSSVDLEH